EWGDQIAEDGSARHRHIDDAELDLVGDVDFLAKLIVGKEPNVDLIVDIIVLQCLDKTIIEHPAIAELGIVGLR
ncbi:hypothetical protein PSY51_23885, partial [Shigella flexneri]|nr:hypothetical protein [Shigella flexneri]